MLIVPFINPLRFKLQGYLSPYQTKYFDEHLYPDTILPIEEPKGYRQPWQTTDTLALHILSDQSDATHVQLNFYKESDNTLIYTISFTPLTTTVIGSTTWYVYTCSAPLAPIGTGNYYTLLSDGDQIGEGNKINICTAQGQTVYVKYRHSKFYGDVLWQFDPTFYMYFRIDGYIRHNLPLRTSTTYEDQVENTTQLKTIPSNSWSYITDSEGVPNYMVHIANWVFGCDSLEIDGRLFTVPQDAKWEPKEEEFYPMRGWGIDMREAIERASLYLSGAPGAGVLPTNPKYNLVSDFWALPGGATELAAGTLSEIWGFDIVDAVEIVEVDREGMEHDIVLVSSPVGRQVKWDGILTKIIFDAANPINTGGESLNVVFKKV
jgi:hypothetical protein